MRKPHVERMASGTYSARISDPMRPGKRIRVTDDTEGKVLQRVERALQLAREVKRGESDPRDLRRRFARIAVGAPTVAEVWDAHASTLRGQWRRKVGGIWRVQIAPMLGKLRVFELTPEKMARWEETQRDEGRGPKTVENAFMALRAAVRAALHDRVDEIPWRTWRPQGPPKGYEPREACRSLQELEALILACAKYDAAAMASAGAFGDLAVRVLVLALTGLRQGEGVALGWDALGLDAEEPENWTLAVKYSAHEDWTERHKVRPLDPPKGNKVRTQTLHAHAALALRHQREKLRARGWYRDDGPVFPARGGGWRHGSQLIDPAVLRECVRLAGLPTEIGKTWTVHSLRHTFATLETWAAWSLTGDVAAAMARTGHSKVEVLMGYLRRAGRGRPAPFIPALGGQAAGFLSEGLPRALPAAEMAPVAALAHRRIGELAAAAATPEKLGAVGLRARRAAKVEGRKAARERPLCDLARAHPTGRPPEVTTRAESRYRRAYLAAQRAGASPEACRQRGGASRRAFLGAWAKAQAQIVRGAQAAAAAAEHEGAHDFEGS
jgi:integrase